MTYRWVATSVAGFVQQLAVSYVTNGYYFYVTGRIPPEKDPAATDRKLMAAYDIGVSKWTRSRRKRDGQANVHYLRIDRFFILIANHGVNPFFEAEAKRLRDIRRYPLGFEGYSIGCRRARGGGEYHASVRIHPARFAELKAHLQSVAVQKTVEELYSELQHLPFEPYAPIRSQFLGLLCAVNRRRKLAGLESVPKEALRLLRRPVKPFSDDEARPRRM